MSKFEEILNKSSYPELEKYCNNKNLVLGQESDKEEGSYKFSIMSKDQTNQNVCSGVITEDKIIIFITDENNNILESYDYKYSDDKKLFDLLKSTIETFEALSALNVSAQEDEILNEDSDDTSESELNEMDSSSLISILNKLKEEIEGISDKFIKASDIAIDVELKANIISMSNSALSLVMEIDDNIDLYNELIMSDEDEEKEELDLESEQRLKYEATKSLIAFKKLNENGKVSNSDVEKFESFLKMVLN